MRTLYFDCFAGAAGDMIAGALIHLGVDPAALESELAKLPLGGYRLHTERVDKRGIQAVQFDVLLGNHLADSEFVEAGQGELTPQSEAGAPHPAHPGEHPHRHLGEILEIIEASELSLRVKQRATAIFRRLAEAEARVHGGSAEDVHFHEVGGIDAIVDVVSAAVGLDLLGVEQVVASPLPLGSGFIRFSHGLYPVPAPATAYLLEGVPVYTTETRGELITPTGAAILTALCGSYGPMPPMTLLGVGYGAGHREREYPNVLRAFLGETSPAPQPSTAKNRTPHPEQHLAPVGPGGYHEAPALVLEANVDDMSPQLFQHLMERLLEAGAMDVLLIPVQMKKGRPGTVLHVLAAPEDRDVLLTLIFSESTTIGVRTYEVTKRMLQRETRTVQTPLGPVRVKVARLGERVVNLSPEYEDCRSLAMRSGVALKDVVQMAREAASREGA